MSETDYESRIQRQFNSYCKKTISNYARDLKRKNAERYEKEYHIEDLPIHERERIEFRNLPDEDGPEIYLADGMVLTKEDLKKAMEILPEKSINIIQLHYYSNLTDSEIGELLNLPRRTATYKRNRALDLIRDYLESLKDEKE